MVKPVNVLTVVSQETLEPESHLYLFVLEDSINARVE